MAKKPLGATKTKPKVGAKPRASRAERIAEATPRPLRTSGSPLVEQLMAAIRDEAFSKEPGALLGGEDELVRRFGVSRPTFRQAAKLVEQEQLLRIKRGVGGGYFVSRPDSAAVAHMTALFLRSHEAGLRDIIEAVRPLYVSTARLAASALTDTLAAEFREFADREQTTLDLPMSTLDYIRSDKKFTILFAESSGNPLIKLFMEIVLAMLPLTAGNIWARHPDRIAESRRTRLLLIHAILHRDVEIAEMAAKRWSQKTSEWVLENEK